MHEYLKQHPNIFMTELKEPNFFGRDLKSSWFINDVNEYLNLFSYNNEAIIGESSVWYLYSKYAACEIINFSSNAKIIIMLRNPVDMIYSLHSQFLYNGNENINDFKTAIELEQKRQQGLYIPKSAHFIEGLYYTKVGMYYNQVERYISCFGKNNVKIILFDEFVKNLDLIYRDTLTFLGVNNTFTPEYKIVNPNKQIKSKGLRAILQSKSKVKSILPNKIRKQIGFRLEKMNTVYKKRVPMSENLRKQLINYYKNEIDRLAVLINKNLDHWKY